MKKLTPIHQSIFIIAIIYAIFILIFSSSYNVATSLFLSLLLGAPAAFITSILVLSIFFQIKNRNIKTKLTPLNYQVLTTIILAVSLCFMITPFAFFAVFLLSPQSLKIPLIVAVLSWWPGLIAGFIISILASRYFFKKEKKNPKQTKAYKILAMILFFISLAFLYVLFIK